MNPPEFRWGQAPPHLATRTQLTAEGLRPTGPVRGYVVWHRGARDAALYDRGETAAKQTPTAGQLAALAEARRARRTCPTCARDTGLVLTRAERRAGLCDGCSLRRWHRQTRAGQHAAAAWARGLLNRSDVVIVDTETTDLHGRLVEIAAVDTAGRVLLDTLVNPKEHICSEATLVHGITDAAVTAPGVPTFPDLADQLAEALHERTVVAYNAAYDRDVLAAELDHLFGGLTGNRRPETRAWLDRCVGWGCAMERFADWVGEWDDYHGGYGWHPLDGGHRARGDALACLDVLHTMASRDPPQPCF